jgi:putative DeoR family transcriptional regulator (stage III sporulation protein D)
MSKKESDTFLKRISIKDNLVEQMAYYIVENNTTVRKTAERFGISKSTVHKKLTVSLREINSSLFMETQNILQKNKSERHLRGGMATKMKYLEAKTR